MVSSFAPHRLGRQPKLVLSNPYLSSPTERRRDRSRLSSHRMRSFQGAFHMNLDDQHWYGWAEMKRDLAEIRREAAELREKAKGKKERQTAVPVETTSKAKEGKKPGWKPKAGE